jgi:hypothetical protein
MKKNLFLLSVLFLGLSLPLISQAVCPVCTIAVGAGVGLCRYLGIDDLITGTWVGGLIVSMIMWAIDWFNKKNIRFKFRKILITVSFYLIIIVPLYWMGIMGHPANKFLGIDKLLFGIISGSVAFVAGVLLNDFLKSRNQGKVFFPFQKVVLPIVFLIIASLVHYFVCLS